MKKTVLFMLAIVGLLACEDEDQEPLTNTSRANEVPPATWAAITEFDVAREVIQWAEAPEINQQIENAFYLREGSVVSVDSILHDSLPDTTYIRVTMNTVEGRDQRVRSGNLTVMSFANWIDTISNEFTVTLNNWLVDETLINGVFTLIPSIVTDSTSFTWRAENVSLTTANTAYSVSVKNGINFIQLVGNPTEWMQDSTSKMNHVYWVNGTVKGYYSSGEYNAIYSDTMLFNYSCIYPQQGKLVVLEPSKTTVQIDRDNTCSANYVWTLDQITGTGTFK